jgi:ribonuclease Z
VTLIGPKGLQRVVAAARVMAPELPFEIRCIEIGGVQEHFSISGYEIDAFRVNHTVTCYGYSISIPRIGKFDAARAMELGIPQNMWNRLQHGENITINNETFYPNMVMGEARRGLKVTYTTDSRPTDSIVENAKGSDLFICEGMYGENDKECKAKENRHMTFEEAAKMAKSADVGQMWLTHFSPSLVRPKDYIDKARKIFPKTELGSDGKTIELRFCD